MSPPVSPLALSIANLAVLQQQQRQLPAPPPSTADAAPEPAPGQPQPPSGRTGRGRFVDILA
jgi:hypothetical protein